MGKLSDRIEQVDISRLRPYKNNAKKHSDEQIQKLEASIKEFGFLSPCLIDREYNLIAGHGRVEAAKRLGWATVPCIYADGLTEAQRRAYILADNRLGELAAWDDDLVSSELEALKALDFDITLTGFDDDDIVLPEEEVHDDDFDVTPPEEPVSRLGDVFVLGRHRLVCGDSTDPEVLHKLMDGQLADLLVTDPPYNVDYTGKTKDALKIQNDQMDDEDFRQFLDNAFLAAKSVMKGGAVFYIWHADSEGYNFRGACHDIGWNVRECLIWKKNSMVLGRQDYQWQHEPCLYGWNDGGSHAWYSDRKQTTILEFDRPTQSKLHPTMKPIPLFDYLIKNSSKKDDIVLDTFGGSGTTIMACEQDGRRGYSCELDPKYVDVIVNRYIALVGSDKDVFCLRDGEKIPWSEMNYKE